MNRTIDNDILLREVCARLSEGKSVKIRAKGNSMRPFIKDGTDSIVLSPIETLRNGDIVLARIDDSRYVLHRIVGINGDEGILRGDANLYGKETCHRNDIFGRADCLIRNGYRHSLTSAKARSMAAIWTAILPLRRFISAARRIILDE